jgi:hypothetical protein
LQSAFQKLWIMKYIVAQSEARDERQRKGYEAGLLVPVRRRGQ